MQKTSRNIDNIWDSNSKKSKRQTQKFNPQYLKIKDYKVDRSTEAYIKLRDEIIKLKALNNNKFRDELNTLYCEKSGISKNQLAYEPYYFLCNQKIFEIIKESYSQVENIEYREKAAAYLLDIEYYQEENIDSDKDILWNCFGDILYKNLCENLAAEKCGVIIPIKRLAYQHASERNEEIAKVAEEAKKELEETYNVDISQTEYDFITSIKCRKDTEKDRYLLYVLLVLYKRKLYYLQNLEDQSSITEDSRSHFRVYKRAKYNKTTRATLDKWLECIIAKKGLERLQKNGIIKIVTCEDYDKIYLPFLKNINEDSEVLFTVRNKNPMYDLYLYNGEAKIKECAICGKVFKVTGNAKTCGKTECSRKLMLRNKNKKAS